MLDLHSVLATNPKAAQMFHQMQEQTRGKSSRERLEMYLETLENTKAQIDHAIREIRDSIARCDDSDPGA